MAERVLICGDRNWKSLKSILIALEIVRDIRGIECVIEGEARGADKMGAEAAKQLGLTDEQILRFPADWKKYNKAAGPIRNIKMLEDGKPTLVLAFHQNIAQSKGTAHMLRISKAAGIPTILISAVA